MKTVYAITTLAGTIIGVGFFALPYLTLKFGLVTILGYFFVLGGLSILIHIIFGELCLATPDFNRFPGFAKIYLGKRGEILAYFSTIFGSLGSLLAYLIVGGEFLAELFSPFLGGSVFIFTLVYFALGAFFIFRGIKAIAKIEFGGLMLFFIILIVLFFKGQGLVDVNNFFLGSWEFNLNNLFFPFGIILFSFWGVNLIPETEEMLGDKKKKLLKIIPLAVLIPFIVYLVFIYLILGVSGSATSESALVGLRGVLGGSGIYLALALGLLATFTSFVAIGLTLKKVLQYDLKMKKGLACLLTCFVPLLLYLIGLQSFIAIISAVGGLLLTLDAILILLMYKKLKPQRKFLVYTLLLVFLSVIIYSIVNLCLC